MIHYHLPGLFEFYALYARFLPLLRRHRDWFYDWCDIGSIYGAPADCLWGGGRVGFGDDNASDVLTLLSEYGISARLTFSNSLLRPEHLADRKCNKLCALFAGSTGLSAGNVRKERMSALSGRNELSESPTGQKELSALSGRNELSESPTGQKELSSLSGRAQNGVIVHSDLLLDYLKKTYPALYLVSSTTKVLTRFEDLRAELDRPEFAFVVPDFRLNKAFDKLEALNAVQKSKVEFLCNECCPVSCTERARCYENVSRKSLGEDVADHVCPNVSEADRFEGAGVSDKSAAGFKGAGVSDKSAAGYEGAGVPDKSAAGFEGAVVPDKSAAGFEGAGGYSFSRAMENPSFISIEDIQKRYAPMGFSNFKIEGRTLGSALILEFLLYYMTKPEAQLRVREAVYLDSALDLF